MWKKVRKWEERSGEVLLRGKELLGIGSKTLELTWADSHQVDNLCEIVPLKTTNKESHKAFFNYEPNQPTEAIAHVEIKNKH